MITPDKNKALRAALQAMQAYDQLGMIPNHKSVIRSLLMCVHDNDDTDCLINKDPTLVALSNQITLHAIEKAKHNS
jgi:hypothetical protein